MSGSSIQAMFGLESRVVVVTGGGRGLGRAIAEGASDAGAAVVIAEVDDALATEAASAIESGGGTCLAVRCDVSRESEIQALFGRVQREFGRVDALVNNAAVNEGSSPPEDLSVEAWERLIRINLTGSFVCAREAGRLMIAQGDGGAIVNVSSINGTTASGRGLMAYDVSKAGVNHLTRSLAVEWARHGIRVNAVQPCQFKPGWGKVVDDPGHAELVRAVLHGIPLGRFGEPHEIVGPVLFLISSAASMVTGVCLPVDGGNLAMNAGAGGVWPAYSAS
jgi:NAD(P)-dependent dehydrogenase (short-subunit alcohol dehydrogenase family)